MGILISLHLSLSSDLVASDTAYHKKMHARRTFCVISTCQALKEVQLH